MRILAIDYGTKRVGLAISDESQTLARELDVVPPRRVKEVLLQLLADYEISGIVLGLPLNMSGEETAKTQEVHAFKSQVEAWTGLPVALVDERLSSVMAEHLPGGRRQTDSLAAQIVLQNYLDTKKNTHQN